jgi:hypothetical protein
MWRKLMADLWRAIKNCLPWLRRCLWWLKQAWLVWLTLLVLSVALLIACLYGSEPAYRYTGMVLQIFGLAAAYYGIEATRKFFHRPSLIQLLKQWLFCFPPFYLPPIFATLRGQGELSDVLLRARAEIWASQPGPAAGADTRLDVLEKNSVIVQQWLTRLQREIDEVAAQQTALVNQETQALTGEVTKLEKRLEASAADGLHVAIMGIIWLLAGVVLSSAAPDWGHASTLNVLSAPGGKITLQGIWLSYVLGGGILAAGLLFWCRTQQLLLYGLIEVVVGLILMVLASQVHGAFSTAFSDNFDTVRITLAVTAYLGGIFTTVRGFDNIKTAWSSQPRCSDLRGKAPKS